MILRRLNLLLWTFALMFGAVEVRLFHLQFVERDFWEAEAKKSRTGGRAVPFHRGAIRDRYGRPLAEGRTVHNVMFRFHDFRRGTPIGLLLGAVRMLTGPGSGDDGPPTVRDILVDPRYYADWVLSRTEDWARAQSTIVANDFRFYVSRLLGLAEGEFAAAIKAADRRASYTTLVAGAVERLVGAVAEQELAIRELARSCDADDEQLLLLIDDKIAGIDAAVEQAVARGGASIGTKQLRAIRKDYENREEVVLKVIPYRTVFLLNLVPERYAGFEVRDVDARYYPEDVESISPRLIGWTGYPGDAMLEQTGRDQLEFAELRNRPPETLDVDDAVAIDQLRTRLRHIDYTPDEETGKEGLEGLLEPVLRGTRGWKTEEWDRLQRHKRLLDLVPATDGQDVRLTLDASLQLVAEKVLAEVAHPSAIVLLDPQDGAIRAMATWPNPSRDDLRQHYAALAADDASFPLNQRAYEPPFNLPPPGSVFKLITAAAALEAGVITADTTLECHGTLQVGSETLKCDGRRAHGSVQLLRALEKSCNIYFYRIAREVGQERMFAMAERFGLGLPSGFGSAERLGLGETSTSIRELVKGGTFSRYPANIMRSAVGQAGFDDVTPLQIATMMGAFANGGARIRPYLIDDIGGRPGPRDVPVPVGISRTTYDLIRTAMRQVVQTGTAAAKDGVDLSRFDVAGKTGTPVDGWRNGEVVQHVWFAGFFPYGAPRIAFAVYGERVDDAVHGGAWGRPVLGRLLSEMAVQPELKHYLGGVGP